MQKCDHPPCTCEGNPKEMVKRGKQRFCSDECAAAEQTTFALTCHCPHTGCGGTVAAASA
jgi:hypothetical protein